MRRGRQAKLHRGQLLPWTRAPYGYLLDPDRPRDASRGQLNPVQAAVVEHIFAWDTEAQRPAKQLSTVWLVMSTGLAAPRPPMSISCAAWSAVANVGARAVGARDTLATMLPSVGAIPMRCGSPAARAARRVMLPHRPWMHWSGRSSAVSCESRPSSRMNWRERRGGHGCPKPCLRAGKRCGRSWDNSNTNKRGCSMSTWRRRSSARSASGDARRWPRATRVLPSNCGNSMPRRHRT